MALSTVQKTLRALIATGILFLVNIMAMAFLSYKIADLDHWTIHTHKVVEELKDCLSAFQDIEIGERGYLVTGEPRFLEPYYKGVKTGMAHISVIGTLTTDNAKQQQAVKQIRVLAQKKLELSEASVKARGSKDVASCLTMQSAGKQTMDEFREQIKIMIASENRLLHSRVHNLEFTQNAIWAVIIGLAALGMTLLIWIFKITRAAIEEEQRRVSELNAEIEQRKRTEHALKETTLNLASSNADLKQFAYVASHDLQEPLRAVTGFLTLLANKQGDNLDAQSLKYINHAVDGAYRMRSLVNDLLAYARVESRGKDLEPVELSKALDGAQANLSAAIEESGAVIINESRLPTVRGDSTQLTQLFQNVIGNAVKFRGTQTPEIKIDCLEQDDSWLISIQDNGRGFDMEHAERIFVIFQRLQGREEASGTGIGLAVCKKIVERHSGRIWAESAPGSGATFFFTLPKLNGDTKNASQ